MQKLKDVFEKKYAISICNNIRLLHSRSPFDQRHLSHLLKKCIISKSESGGTTYTFLQAKQSIKNGESGIVRLSVRGYISPEENCNAALLKYSQKIHNSFDFFF